MVMCRVCPVSKLNKQKVPAHETRLSMAVYTDYALRAWRLQDSVLTPFQGPVLPRL